MSPDLTPCSFTKTPLLSCPSHAGLLAHLSLRRRRRAEPAAMLENGNSGPRRSGKLRSEHGWQRAEQQGRSPIHPFAQSGDAVSSTPPPSVSSVPSHACCSSCAPPFVGCFPLIRFVLTHVERDISMLTSPGVALMHESNVSFFVWILKKKKSSQLFRL